MNKDIIIVKNASYSYPGSPPVLDGASLTIGRGEFVVLSGPNGAAKTTLLRIILGLIKPQQGTVQILPRDTVIGYVPQKPPVFNPGFPATVAEAVGLQIGFGSHRKQTVKQTLEKVHLSEKSHCLLGCLSGGQLQRVHIARALACSPQVLILDEPTSGLDVQSQADFLNLLNDLHKQGLTILMVTHEASPLRECASRLITLGGGKIIEAGGHTNLKSGVVFGNAAV